MADIADLMRTCDKCGEEIAEQFDSCWKCAGEPDPIGLPIGTRMKESRRQVVRGVLLAFGVIPSTWLCFGPISAFHHMIGFGVTFYLVLDGETPGPGDHIWGTYAVRFFLGRFILGFVIWLIAVFITFKLVRFWTRKGYTP